MPIYITFFHFSDFKSSIHISNFSGVSYRFFPPEISSCGYSVFNPKQQPERHPLPSGQILVFSILSNLISYIITIITILFSLCKLKLLPSQEDQIEWYRVHLGTHQVDNLQKGRPYNHQYPLVWNQNMEEVFPWWVETTSVL